MRTQKNTNMKKVLFPILALHIGLSTANAQTYLWNLSGTDVTTVTNGDCEVGGKQFIKGGALDMTIPGSWSTSTPDPWRSINCGASYGGLWINTGTTTLDGSYIKMHTPDNTSDPGAIVFTSSSLGSSGSGFTFFHHDINPSAPTDNSLMTLDNWGQMQVNGALLNLRSSTWGYDKWRAINCGTNSTGLYLNTGNTTTDGTYIQMHAPNESDAGAMQFVSNSAGTMGSGFSFTHYDPIATASNKLLTLDNWGQMQVNGALLNFRSDAWGYDKWRAINCGTNSTGLYINTGNTTTDGTFIQLHAANESSNPGGLDLVSNVLAGTGYGTTFSRYDGSIQTDMRINNKGKVIIGKSLIATNNAPDGYLLFVEKGILTEKLKVANSSDPANWADFVFNEDYELMPLHKVESFIKKNKHLPEIPSAEEVSKEGIDVAAMDAKLLQKIEELTLYVIKQQKEIDELKKQKSSN